MGAEWVVDSLTKLTSGSPLFFDAPPKSPGPKYDVAHLSRRVSKEVVHSSVKDDDDEDVFVNLSWNRMRKRGYSRKIKSLRILFNDRIVLEGQRKINE